MYILFQYMKERTNKHRYCDLGLDLDFNLTLCTFFQYMKERTNKNENKKTGLENKKTGTRSIFTLTEQEITCFCITTA